MGGSSAGDSPGTLDLLTRNTNFSQLPFRRNGELPWRHVGGPWYGLAEWYDNTCATTGSGLVAREAALRLLGDGPGRLIDIGCGTGSHTAAFAQVGWSVVGVDISDDQLRLALERGCEVVRADAAELPFREASFDAAVSMFTHTDLDDFAAVLHETRRVLRDGSRLVYVGVHPCFVGPHSVFFHGNGVPVLHPGYRRTARYTDAPGVSPNGLRARVGATHLPLSLFLQAFLEAELRVDRFEELEAKSSEYPHLVAVGAHR